MAFRGAQGVQPARTPLAALRGLNIPHGCPCPYAIWKARALPPKLRPQDCPPVTQVSPRDRRRAAGVSGAGPISAAAQRGVGSRRRGGKNLFRLIFWACILKGGSPDSCWGHLSSPGVSWKGVWEREGGRGRRGGREGDGEREGGMKVGGRE